MQAEAEAALKPAGAKPMAAAINHILDFARTYQIPTGDVAKATAFYSEVLAGLPDDLLHAAVSETLQGCRYGNRLPLPGEFRGSVAERMAARVKRLNRAKWAQKIAARRQADAAERARVQQEREAKWAKTDTPKPGESQ